jgi:hypothetical protein
MDTTSKCREVVSPEIECAFGFGRLWRVHPISPAALFERLTTPLCPPCISQRACTPLAPVDAPVSSPHAESRTTHHPHLPASISCSHMARPHALPLLSESSSHLLTPQTTLLRSLVTLLLSQDDAQRGNWDSKNRYRVGVQQRQSRIPTFLPHSTTRPHALSTSRSHDKLPRPSNGRAGTFAAELFPGKRPLGWGESWRLTISVRSAMA